MNERYLSRHNTSFIDIDATLKPSVDKKLLWGACLWVVIGILTLVPLALIYKPVSYTHLTLPTIYSV